MTNKHDKDWPPIPTPSAAARNDLAGQAWKMYQGIDEEALSPQEELDFPRLREEALERLKNFIESEEGAHLTEEQRNELSFLFVQLLDALNNEESAQERRILPSPMLAYVLRRM